MYFSLWKNENFVRRQLYNCEACILKGENEKRECLFFKDKINIPKHIFNEETKQLSREECYVEEGDIDDLFEEMLRIQEIFPGRPLWDVFSEYMLKAGICPQCCYDENLADLIELESHCSEYKVLPEDGGILDQLNYIMDAFSEIRGSKAEYMAEMSEKAMQESKSKSNKKVR